MRRDDETDNDDILAYYYNLLPALSASNHALKRVIFPCLLPQTKRGYYCMLQNYLSTKIIALVLK